jgi:small GTP-binding protein
MSFSVINENAPKMHDSLTGGRAHKIVSLPNRLRLILPFSEFQQEVQSNRRFCLKKHPGTAPSLSKLDHCMRHIKVVIVGDDGVGKTCLAIAYETNAFPGEYIPHVFDVYNYYRKIDDQDCNVLLWDTPGQREHDKTRPLSYPGANVFLICFSLVAPTSLESVRDVWVPEVTKHCPDTPYILVGTKSDLRDEFAQHPNEYASKGLEPVPTSKGEEMKKAIKAQRYIECSARIDYNVTEAFEAAVRLVLPPQQDKSDAKRCEVA